MKYANRPALVRVAVIDQQLRSGRFPNASSLAQDLEVTPRTIHRDFDFLRQSFGAPLTFDAAHNGYFYSDCNFRLPFLSISEGEYLALFLAERLMQEYRSTPCVEDLHRLFEKITRLLTDPITIDLRHLAGSFSVHHANFTADSLGVMRDLHAAIQQRRRLEITYQSMTRKDATVRMIDPYHLASIDGDWYLIAYCHRRNAVLMFVPSRIRAVRETGTTLEEPHRFDMNEYLKGAFRKVRGDGELQTVRLRFAPTAARYVRERAWHPTQELHEHPDGSLTMTLRVDHLVEVKRWALSFGAECEALGPQELRCDIERDLREMVARFSESKGGRR